MTYVKCLAHDLTQDSIKSTYSWYYCCTVIITVIIHPPHLPGEGDRKTQRDNTRGKKGLKTNELNVESFPDLVN